MASAGISKRVLVCCCGARWTGSGSHGQEDTFPHSLYNVSCSGAQPGRPFVFLYFVLLFFGQFALGPSGRLCLIIQLDIGYAVREVQTGASAPWLTWDTRAWTGAE